MSHTLYFGTVARAKSHMLTGGVAAIYEDYDNEVLAVLPPDPGEQYGIIYKLYLKSLPDEEGSKGLGQFYWKRLMRINEDGTRT